MKNLSATEARDEYDFHLFNFFNLFYVLQNNFCVFFKLWLRVLFLMQRLKQKKQNSRARFLFFFWNGEFFFLNNLRTFTSRVIKNVFLLLLGWTLLPSPCELIHGKFILATTQPQICFLSLINIETYLRYYANFCLSQIIFVF